MTIDKGMLTEFFDARRSYYPRQYSGKRISDEVIKEILEYAGTAPTHKLTRPWRFKVYADQSKEWLLDEMKQYYLDHTAPEEVSQQRLKKFDIKKEKTSHILAVWVKLDEDKIVPEIEEVMATACAVQNIYLSLSSYGLGGYWSTGNFTFDPATPGKLDLKQGEQLLGFFYLGHMDEVIPRAPRPSIEPNVEWVKE